MRHHPSAYWPKRGIGTAVLLVLTTCLLAGCETSGGPSNPLSELVAYSSGARASAQADTRAPARQDPPRQATAKPEAPKTRAQAAMVCWGLVEKSHAGASLEARADFVTSCIDGKLKTVDTGSDARAEAKPAAAKPRQSADAKPAQ